MPDDGCLGEGVGWLRWVVALGAGFSLVVKWWGGVVGGCLPLTRSLLTIRMSVLNPPRLSLSFIRDSDIRVDYNLFVTDWRVNFHCDRHAVMNYSIK